jgi:hypothetical protein
VERESSESRYIKRGNGYKCSTVKLARKCPFVLLPNVSYIEGKVRSSEMDNTER